MDLLVLVAHMIAAPGDSPASFRTSTGYGQEARGAPTTTRSAIALRRDQSNIGVLVFSQYVETRYATQLLAKGSAGVGYLLKDRVADVREFVDALERVAAGGTALDPEVVFQLVGASRRGAALDA